MNACRRIGSKPTVKVHVRPDGSEFTIRFCGGRQEWDAGCYAPNLGVAQMEIEKRGGRVETRPRSPQNEIWDDSLVPELKVLVRRASSCR